MPNIPDPPAAHTQAPAATLQEATLQEATLQNQGVQYLLIALAGRDYGLRLASLQEVMRYQPQSVAPLPNMPAWLEGVFSLRGTIISVVDLRSFLGLPRLAQDGDRLRAVAGPDQLFGIGRPVPRLLILGNAEIQTGLVVDDIKGVLFVQPEGIRPVRPGPPDPAEVYLQGDYIDPETGNRTRLLDTLKLINSPALLAFNVQLV